MTFDHKSMVSHAPIYRDFGNIWEYRIYTLFNA